jgi:hypothetical protein
MLPATARATGKSAKGERNMRPRISMSQAEEWRPSTDEIIGVRPCLCEPLRSARQRAPPGSPASPHRRRRDRSPSSGLHSDLPSRGLHSDSRTRGIR